LNKNFEGLEELKRVVLEEVPVHPVGGQVSTYGVDRSGAELTGVRSATPRQFRYDLAFLSFISVFVLTTAIFVVYANNKNIKQVARLISKETVLNSTSVIYSPDRSNNISAELTGVRSATSTTNGEMTSKKWKVIPGNIPVLSSGETGEEKNSKEL